jgi:hypothetical protein
LFNRSTNSGTDGLGCLPGEREPSVGSRAFVPLDGDISSADTVVFGAERFFLKKTADFALAWNCDLPCDRKTAAERLSVEVVVDGTFETVACSGNSGETQSFDTAAFLFIRFK